MVGRPRSPVWDSGPVCVGLAALIFSLSGLFVKLLHGHIPEFEIVVCRSFLSFLACAVASYRNDIKPFFGHMQNVPLLLGRALSGSVAMALYYFSLNQLALADAVTLFFLNPAITAVVARPVLKEPLGALGITGVLVSLLGVVLVSQPPALFNRGEQDWSYSQTVGTVLGVSSAVLASVAFIFIRLIGKKESPVTMSVYFHLTALTTSGIPLAFGFPRPAVLPSPIALLLLLGISASSFWGQLLIGRGLQLLSAARAGAINITQVLYSYLIGVILLNEPFSWLSLIGSMFIGLGVVCVSSKPKAKQQEYMPVSTSEETIAEGNLQPPRPAMRGGSLELESGGDLGGKSISTKAGGQDLGAGQGADEEQGGHGAPQGADYGDASSKTEGVQGPWEQGQVQQQQEDGQVHQGQQQQQQQAQVLLQPQGASTPQGTPLQGAAPSRASIEVGQLHGSAQLPACASHGDEDPETQLLQHAQQQQGGEANDGWYGCLLGPVEGHEAGMLSLQQAQVEEERLEGGGQTSGWDHRNGHSANDRT